MSGQHRFNSHFTFQLRRLGFVLFCIALLIGCASAQQSATVPDMSTMMGPTPGYMPVYTSTSGSMASSVMTQSGNNIGIGTANPMFNLHVISGTDPAAVAVDGYGSVGVNFIGRRAEGTPSVPLPLNAGDNIFILQGRGFGSTEFSQYSRASIKMVAHENWNDAAQGTYIMFATTPDGTAPAGSAAERMRIDHNGNVGIGTSTPTSMLTVNGTIESLTGGMQITGNSVINGNLHVNGTLSKSAGTFKIDDPLDPANKYLSHSFVESPDMMNIYNGNIVTDKHGVATVELPSYFEALNQEFRYQLTVIGQFAQAIVVHEIDHNHFTIKTNKPSVKVSWQVTGIRHDAYANAHRVVVEEDKGKERGTYLHPELFQKDPVLAKK